MLKKTWSSVASASRVDDNEVISSGGAINGSAVSWSNTSKKSAKSKSQIKSRHFGNSNNLDKLKFLTSKAKKAFNCLRQAFTKASILQYFDLECHIRIETDALGYAIKGVLNQLISNQVTSDGTIGSNVDWYPVVYFSRKMIPGET